MAFAIGAKTGGNRGSLPAIAAAATGALIAAVPGIARNHRAVLYGCLHFARPRDTRFRRCILTGTHAQTPLVGTEPDDRTGGRWNAVCELESPHERLVCMYLARVPAASAADLEEDLRMPREATAAALQSLLEHEFVRQRGGLYVLSSDRV